MIRKISYRDKNFVESADEIKLSFGCHHKISLGNRLSRLYLRVSKRSNTRDEEPGRNEKLAMLVTRVIATVNFLLLLIHLLSVVEIIIVDNCIRAVPRSRNVAGHWFLLVLVNS